MLETVLGTISRHRMLSPGGRVIAAVSGGPDSVCLLDILHQLAPRLKVTLAGVAHLNHKLRGEASDADERFVSELAERFGIKYYREEADLTGPGNLEQAARCARQEFFTRLIRSGAADRVATGHTRDDQAETVLFRLIRGSGPGGLTGIRPITAEGLIRPLLDVTRADVEQHLRSRGIEWREDATNRDSRFSRNRIRNELLPLIAQGWNPRIREALARFAEVAGEEESWWQQEIDRIARSSLTCVDSGLEISCSEVARTPRAVARRLIRHAIAEIRGDDRPLAFEHVERVLDLAAQARGEGTVNLPGLEAVRSFGSVRFQKANEPAGTRVLVKVPGRYAWGSTTVCLAVSETICEQAICARLKLRGQGEPKPLELRSWRVGDHYRPAGKSREYTIHELFQRARVPSWKRHAWPVLSSGPEIIWVRQFGASSSFAATEPGPALCIWEEKSPNA